MMEQVKELQKLIDTSKNIVFFGGAGVSTASGIPDFRSENGLYNCKQKWEYTPEKMLSHSFYERHKAAFFNFYKEVMCVTDCEPNSVHYKLAELEEKGKLKAIITQNVDGLHQKAGSKNVIEIHGTIHKNKCQVCGKEFAADYVKNSENIPYCDECDSKYAVVKPCVTLYQEKLPAKEYSKAEKAIKWADLIIVAGTSLSVYPAALLIEKGYVNDAKIVIINKGETKSNNLADLVIDADMVEIFKQLVI